MSPIGEKTTRNNLQPLTHCTYALSPKSLINTTQFIKIVSLPQLALILCSTRTATNQRSFVANLTRCKMCCIYANIRAGATHTSRTKTKKEVSWLSVAEWSQQKRSKSACTDRHNQFKLRQTCTIPRRNCFLGRNFRQTYSREAPRFQLPDSIISFQNSGNCATILNVYSYSVHNQ